MFYPIHKQKLELFPLQTVLLVPYVVQQRQNPIEIYGINKFVV